MCKSFSCTNTAAYLGPVWVRLRRHTGNRSKQVCEPCRRLLLLLLLLCMRELMGGLEGRGAGLKVTLIKPPLMVNSHHVNVGEFLWLVVTAGVPGMPPGGHSGSSQMLMLFFTCQRYHSGGTCVDVLLMPLWSFRVAVFDFCLDVLYIARSRCCSRLRGNISLPPSLSGAQPASPWEQVCFRPRISDTAVIKCHLLVSSGFQVPACCGQTLSSLLLLWRLPYPLPQKDLLLYPVPPAPKDLPLTPTCPLTGPWMDQKTTTSKARRFRPPTLIATGEGCLLLAV